MESDFIGLLGEYAPYPEEARRHEALKLSIQWGGQERIPRLAPEILSDAIWFESYLRFDDSFKMKLDEYFEKIIEDEAEKEIKTMALI